jgi:hypothetical protein
MKVLVHVGLIVGTAGIGERPDMIGEHAIGPARLLLQDHGGRARDPLPAVDQRISPGRPLDSRPETRSDPPGVGIAQGSVLAFCHFASGSKVSILRAIFSVRSPRSF